MRTSPCSDIVFEYPFVDRLAARLRVHASEHDCLKTSSSPREIAPLMESERNPFIRRIAAGLPVQPGQLSLPSLLPLWCSAMTSQPLAPNTGLPELPGSVGVR